MMAGLINHLWQSTLFCAAIWLITRALRANSAALRHWLWLMASVKFLVPFSLLYLIGTYIGLPAARVVGDQPSPLGDALQNASLLVSPTSVLRASESVAGSSAVMALLAIWLGGALFVASRWLLAWRTADSIARAARPAPGAPADARVTDADIEPAVARIFHPVVLLPAALLGRLTDRQLNAVLAHEHEHIARHDNLKDGVHRLVETLFWFHPAVWWIGRQLVEERERACDEAVLERGHAGVEYAAGILEVCRHCRGRTPVTSSATSGDLTQRVRYILGNARPANMGVLKVGSLLLMTTAVAAVPMLAGAVENAVRRHELLTINSLALGTAEVFISPAAGNPVETAKFFADRNVVQIRNQTLRDLIALAYGVKRWQIDDGGGQWLDSPRYDIRAVARLPVSEPADLDPLALRGVVAKLLAAHFDLEIHVNHRCQDPCGRIALAAVNHTGR